MRLDTYRLSPGHSVGEDRVRMLAEAMEVIGQSASLQTCKLNAFNALV